MIIAIRARLRSLWMNGSGSFRFLMTDTAARINAGNIQQYYDDNGGNRLSSNSNASLELVVTKLRNISTAMMDCPKKV